MRVRAKLITGEMVEVFPEMLETLIATDRVRLFNRGDRWVVVGRDPVRGRPRKVKTFTIQLDIDFGLKLS